MDYLLRDSHHVGVEYGRYDWRRIAVSVTVVMDPETETPRLGIEGGGRHAAEALIIARYMMFSQVYFHKTRVIVDYHLQSALTSLLPGGLLPRPVGQELAEFQAWDDWRVLGALAAGEGGEHGDCLRSRKFYKQVWETPEFPTADDEVRLERAAKELGGLVKARLEAGKLWYKVGGADLLILDGKTTKPLSLCSTIVGNMQPSRCTRLYVTPESRQQAEQQLQKNS